MTAGTDEPRSVSDVLSCAWSGGVKCARRRRPSLSDSTESPQLRRPS